MRALLATTMLCSAPAFALFSPDLALAQTRGGNGGSGAAFTGGPGGGYEQNGGNGAPGNTMAVAAAGRGQQERSAVFREITTRAAAAPAA